MAALIKGLKLASQVANRNPAFMLTLSRAAHWNKDFKPGKLPVTEEERIAAAKKYNLIPAEYKPYADDGMGYGDYPQLPDIPTERRDPYYPYDYPELKRNFGEPVHVDIDVIGEDRFGSAEPLRFTIGQQFAAFVAVMAGCLGLYYFLENKKMFRPLLPKQFPDDGKKHYTFATK